MAGKGDVINAIAEQAGISKKEAAAAFDDAELVRLLVTGNRDAMEVIFDRYYRLVMRITLNIVRDTGEAQDVCQIVFTDFYRHAKLFDPARGNLKTWLMQYAYGRSINGRRRLKARGFYEQTDIEAVNPALLVRGAKLFAALCNGADRIDLRRNDDVGEISSREAAKLER